MTEQDRKEATNIARREIARALRMLAEYHKEYDRPGDDVLRELADAFELVRPCDQPTPAPDPRTVQALNAIAVPCADALGNVIESHDPMWARAADLCAAPSTLPPLVGPVIPTGPIAMFSCLSSHGIDYVQAVCAEDWLVAAREWERIAHAERAAREADIARLEREAADAAYQEGQRVAKACDEMVRKAERGLDEANAQITELVQGAAALRERAEKAERERDAATNRWVTAVDRAHDYERERDLLAFQWDAAMKAFGIGR